MAAYENLNPFLFGDSDSSAINSGSASLNPFLDFGEERSDLRCDGGGSAEGGNGINPFLMDIAVPKDLADGNLDVNLIETDVHSSLGKDAFQPTFDIHSPPDVRVEASHEARQLVQSITGHLESTADTLLDRMQAAKTPTPSHDEAAEDSPAASPEPPELDQQSGVMDLLGDSSEMMLQSQPFTSIPSAHEPHKMSLLDDSPINHVPVAPPESPVSDGTRSAFSSTVAHETVDEQSYSPTTQEIKTHYSMVKEADFGMSHAGFTADVPMYQSEALNPFLADLTPEVDLLGQSSHSMPEPVQHFQNIMDDFMMSDEPVVVHEKPPRPSVPPPRPVPPRPTHPPRKDIPSPSAPPQKDIPSPSAPPRRDIPSPTVSSWKEIISPEKVEQAPATDFISYHPPELIHSIPVLKALSSPQSCATIKGMMHKDEPDFDAFAARFESAAAAEGKELEVATGDPFDPFGAPGGGSMGNFDDTSQGFGFESESFDPFLVIPEPPPVPKGTPAHTGFENGFSTVAFTWDQLQQDAALQNLNLEHKDEFSLNLNLAVNTHSSAANPFLEMTETAMPSTDFAKQEPYVPRAPQRTDSGETPSTPLFEEDQTEPLEAYPRTVWKEPEPPCWEMYLRQPNKKKIASQRFWKKIYVRQAENGTIQLFNSKEDKDPFQELPLQPCYAVSDIGAQQFDQFGKIFTVKLQYVFYKERPGVRPGQVSKAERLTSRLSQFASYAIAGDLAGVKEFGSDLKKLGIPIEHAPQVSELLKLGSRSHEDLKVFSSLLEEHLFKLPLHRDRSLTYKTEEVQITALDEIYVEQNYLGHVGIMVARVRLFFLAFLSGMPEVELGVNDNVRQGKEVVGRHDIIPVITEEWIRLEDVEFHTCVQQDHYQHSKTIKFVPPDACYIELMRLRIRPPRNRELPLQLKTVFNITGRKVEIRADILVPGSCGKMGMVPCEDIQVRLPLPEQWIYLFRVEKHFRYGSVKSAHRRMGKVKGLERFLGAVDTLDQAMMETSSGQAKYEHQHRAIVWRIPRLPKEGQGAYTSHTFVCRLCLTAYDQIPDTFDKYCVVEFTMPATTVSHFIVRSVSVNCPSPPEKYVRYLARHEYKTEIEFTQGSEVHEYIAATAVETSAAPQLQNNGEMEAKSGSGSDSD
ncbi:unnamed protein product [Darwinula stevensoni]|uniref:Protein stoned-B n=1 Tax=Darwinula stevensoni TaxID=69355 RepID=A0A7R8XCV5_9CRUS|nr:unnamed protein product [Darwinula stevensoni]CAG0894062.1 unnamed protein product [Darwinula stevensoni]